MRFGLNSRRSLIVGWVVLAGCSKSPQKTEAPVQEPTVDNAATRYTQSLQQDVQKAHMAVDKMNATTAHSQELPKDE